MRSDHPPARRGRVAMKDLVRHRLILYWSLGMLRSTIDRTPRTEVNAAILRARNARHSAAMTEFVAHV